MTDTTAYPRRSKPQSAVSQSIAVDSKEVEQIQVTRPVRGVAGEGGFVNHFTLLAEASCERAARARGRARRMRAGMWRDELLREAQDHEAAARLYEQWAAETDNDAA